jgi:hypothetical protein
MEAASIRTSALLITCTTYGLSEKDEGAAAGEADDWNTVAAKTGCRVGEMVGTADGEVDGAAVGASVGAALGSSVGVAIGNFDGAAVGADVVVAVGAADGAFVGHTVGTAVGAVGRNGPRKREEGRAKRKKYRREKLYTCICVCVHFTLYMYTIP